ncbi:MAG TPA: hypothetical protein VIF12_04745 [Micavibrio sp.]
MAVKKPGVPAVTDSERIAAANEVFLREVKEKEQEAKKRQEETKTVQTQPKPGFSAAGTPKDGGGQQEPKIAQTVAEQAVADTQESIQTPPDDSINENEICLKAIADLFGIPELSDKDKLRSLTLASAISQTSLTVKTTSNQVVIAKGKVEFERGVGEAVDAFEGAILAKNDSASYPDGVYLNGNLVERYTLMLAADHIGLTLAKGEKEALLKEVKKASSAERKAIEGAGEKWCEFVAMAADPIAPAGQAIPQHPKTDEVKAAAEEMTAPQTPVSYTDPNGRIDPVWTGAPAFA